MAEALILKPGEFYRFIEKVVIWVGYDRTDPRFGWIRYAGTRELRRVKMRILKPWLVRLSPLEVLALQAEGTESTK